MFGLFKKRELPDEIAGRVYVETLEVFSTLKISQNLADMHRLAMAGECSDADRDDLVMGAYRTLFLAAGLAKHRMRREMQSEAAAEKVANQMLNDSGIRNIVAMIRESVTFTCDELMIAVARESAMLFQAASMFDRLLRQQQFGKALEVWRTCAKGAYAELPLISVR